jgi:uncharacterized protein (TIGR00290 family)
VIPRPRAAISWSGGKDSCAALMRVQTAFDVVTMVTMVDENAARSRSHGLRPEVLDAQAERLRLPRLVGRCTWESYDDAFSAVVEQLASNGITHIVFGDILFEEHRRWAERQCERHGLSAVEPLWGRSTEELFDEWIESDSDALIVTARATSLDSTWLGRTLHRNMRSEFARLGVDPCGERGEYHTVVTSTPMFTHPLQLEQRGVVERSGCWALDVSVCHAPRI